MKTITILVLIALLVVVTIGSINRAPAWYEAQGDHVYTCVGLQKDDGMGMCFNIADDSDWYETVYKPDFSGGEYHEFKGPNMGETCVVLRKGNVYDPETLCDIGIVDTKDMLKHISG